MSQLVDRFDFAATLIRGKRVLDIGGQHPFNHQADHPFHRAYRRMAEGAAQYEILDREVKPGVKYGADLNTADGRARLTEVLRIYAPEVVLCMEVLEHLNYPCEIMDVLGDYLAGSHAVLFVTLPNNGNWILNALNWHSDHNFAFFGSIAERFVRRSRLGRCRITVHPCMQRYRWYWWLVYALAGGQPFNWGFEIAANRFDFTTTADAPSNQPERIQYDTTRYVGTASKGST